MAKVSGGIYIPQLKNEVVKPALEFIGFGGTKAVNLVTGTFLAEGYAGSTTYLKQLGSGPAIGPMQMEPATYNDIWKNFLSMPRRSSLSTALKQLAGDWNTDNNNIPKVDVMKGNIYFAAAMCRVFYLRIVEALPGDAEGMSKYHKKYYNTYLGKAIWQDNVDRFTQAISA